MSHHSTHRTFRQIRHIRFLSAPEFPSADPAGISGIQCDQYSILGEILEVHTVNNIVTDEELVQMTIESNNMQFDVCINRKDLLGDPQVGRRFKGTIWLQGQLQF